MSRIRERDNPHNRPRGPVPGSLSPETIEAAEQEVQQRIALRARYRKERDYRPAIVEQVQRLTAALERLTAARERFPALPYRRPPRAEILDELRREIDELHLDLAMIDDFARQTARVYGTTDYSDGDAFVVRARDKDSDDVILWRVLIERHGATAGQIADRFGDDITTRRTFDRWRHDYREEFSAARDELTAQPDRIAYESQVESQMNGRRFVGSGADQLRAIEDVLARLGE